MESARRGGEPVAAETSHLSRFCRCLADLGLPLPGDVESTRSAEGQGMWSLRAVPRASGFVESTRRPGGRWSLRALGFGDRRLRGAQNYAAIGNFNPGFRVSGHRQGEAFCEMPAEVPQLIVATAKLGKKGVPSDVHIPTEGMEPVC